MFKNFIFKIKIGLWLYMTYHRVNSRYIVIYNCLQGKCPFCGEHWAKHHEAERLAFFAKVEKLKSEIEAE